jgi:hypothetical protein
MASQSSIAESSNIVTSDELNYDQKLFSHSQTKYNAQFPNTFGQAISLGASQTPVTINIGPNVFNMGEAILNYTVNIPAGAAYVWYHRQALPGISHIQYYANNSMYILDLDNVANYCDIVIKKETSRQDFLSLDPNLNNIGQSNSPVNVVPALRNSNTTVANAPNLAANPSSVNYTEPAYFSVSNNALPVTLNVSFKLNLLKNTWFSCAKEMYCPLTTYLKIYFGPVSKLCYYSTSNASPSAGVKTSYTGAATITNLQLMLPIETNENIIALMMNKVQTSGLKFIIPYPVAFKNSNSTQTQTISIQFDGTNGQTLQKVIHSVYNSTEDLDMAFDHANNDVVAGAAASPKVQLYYTMLNSKRQQDLTLDCTSTGPYLDYLQNRKYLEGSIISNQNVYAYNWHHTDDYCQFGSDYDQNNTGNLIAGVPLGLSPLTWAFYGQTMRANAFQHYTWAIFSKKMIIEPTGQIIVE